MAAITYSGDTPGRAGTRQVWAQGGRPMKIVSGTFAFDDSYLTGGESISDIFAQFKGVGSTSGLVFIAFEDAVGHTFAVDRTTAGSETVRAYVKTTGAQVANAVDLSSLLPAVPFLAFGFIK